LRQSVELRTGLGDIAAADVLIDLRQLLDLLAPPLGLVLVPPD